MPEPASRQEQARQAYQAQRLASRRSVRMALALSQGLRYGPRAARELFTAGAGELDVPGPEIYGRTWYPSLRLAHLSDDPITASLIPGTRLLPDRWRTQLRRDRPDLILLDQRWSDETEFRALLSENGHRFVIDRSALAMPLDVTGAIAFGGMDGRPIVNERRFNPIGMPPRPSGSIRALADSAETVDILSDGGARADVLVSSGGDAQISRDLELQASGAVVVPKEPSPAWGESCGSGGTVQRDPKSFLELRRWERASVASRRSSLLSFDRHAALERTLSVLGLAPAPPRISVLLCTRRPDHVTSALAQIDAQRYPNLEIVIGLHGFQRPPDEALRCSASRRIRIVEVGGDCPLGAVLNAALDESTGQFIAKMDDDDLYGPDHLGDLMLTLRYSGATIVGRRNTATYLEKRGRTVTPPPEHQERWTTHLPGATMLVHADALRRVRWRDVPNAVDTELVRSITSDGGTVYSTHGFGFIRRRHDGHTYARSDRSFRGARVVEGLDRAVLEIPGGMAG